jgi:hypothetical protein
LDFLEFVDYRGTILSSAQWPAKFGYKETALPNGAPPKDAFLRQEELPDGAALSLSAIRRVQVGDKPVYVIGGRRLDQGFMGSLELPAGMRAMLYPNLAKGFSAALLVTPTAACNNRICWRRSLSKCNNSARKLPRFFIGPTMQRMMRVSTPFL